MAAKRPSIRFALLASLLAGGLLACQLIVGVDDDVGATRPPDAGTGDAGDATTPCNLHKPQAVSATSGGAGKNAVTYYAVERFVITPAEDAGAESVIGYDLDDRCTGLPTARSEAPCVTPDGGDKVVDDDGGVDNTFRRIFGELPLASTDLTDPGAAFFNKAIGKGTRTVLIALGDYNGEADDSDVHVALFASEGLLPTRDGGTAPVGDGLDEWSHTGATQFLPGGPALPLLGYVTGSMLVARMDNLTLSFGGFSLTLHEATLTANIDAAGPGRLVNGTISGRIVANELIAAAGQIPVNGQYCFLSSYDGLRSAVCSHRDLAAPGTARSAACDSVSLGMGFKAVAAKVPDVIKDASAEACAAPTCSP